MKYALHFYHICTSWISYFFSRSFFTGFAPSTSCLSVCSFPICCLVYLSRSPSAFVRVQRGGELWSVGARPPRFKKSPICAVKSATPSTQKASIVIAPITKGLWLTATDTDHIFCALAFRGADGVRRIGDVY